MPASPGFHVFTTLLVKDGQPQFLDGHLERLANHVDHFGIAFAGAAALRAAVVEHVTPGTYLLRMAVDRAGNLTISPREVNLPTSYEAARIILTDIQVDSNFAAYKTSERGPYAQAHELAAQWGAFEALLVDADGYVVDGYRSSPLLFSSGELISLEGGLRGITREKVLSEASKLGIRILREQRKAHELQGVLLVAGSGMGLVPAQAVGDTRLRKLIDQFRPI